MIDYNDIQAAAKELNSLKGRADALVILFKPETLVGQPLSQNADPIRGLNITTDRPIDYATFVEMEVASIN